MTERPRNKDKIIKTKWSQSCLNEMKVWTVGPEAVTVNITVGGVGDCYCWGNRRLLLLLLLLLLGKCIQPQCQQVTVIMNLACAADFHSCSKSKIVTSRSESRQLLIQRFTLTARLYCLYIMNNWSIELFIYFTYSPVKSRSNH